MHRQLRGAPVGMTVLLYSSGYGQCLGEAECVEVVPLNVAIESDNERQSVIRSWWPSTLDQRERKAFDDAVEKARSGRLTTPVFRYMRGQEEMLAYGVHHSWTFPGES